MRRPVTDGETGDRRKVPRNILSLSGGSGWCVMVSDRRPRHFALAPLPTGGGLPFGAAGGVGCFFRVDRQTRSSRAGDRNASNVGSPPIPLPSPSRPGTGANWRQSSAGSQNIALIRLQQNHQEIHTDILSQEMISPREAHPEDAEDNMARRTKCSGERSVCHRFSSPVFRHRFSVRKHGGFAGRKTRR